MAGGAAADRPDPIALLEDQAASRVPELVPIRDGRMLVAVHLLPGRGADHGGRPFAHTERPDYRAVCGDAHLSNFGLFGSPERRVLFEINDFDGTLPGPWEWDVSASPSASRSWAGSAASPRPIAAPWS